MLGFKLIHVIKRGPLSADDQATDNGDRSTADATRAMKFDKFLGNSVAI